MRKKSLFKTKRFQKFAKNAKAFGHKAAIGAKSYTEAVEHVIGGEETATYHVPKVKNKKHKESHEFYNPIGKIDLESMDLGL